MRRFVTLLIVGGVLRASLGVVAARSPPPDRDASAGSAGSASAAPTGSDTTIGDTEVGSDGPAPSLGSSASTSGNGDSSTTLYSVPDIPALTAISATSNKIDRPESASGIGASLANIVDTDGTIRSGVGIEVSPHALGIDQRWTYFQYRHDWWRRFLSQSALSIGTVKGSTSSMAAGADTKAAVGARLVFWDQADPLLSTSYMSAVAFAQQQCKSETDPNAAAKCEAKAYDDYNQWKDVPWNAGSLFAAVAETWDFSDGTLGSHKAETLSSWIAAGMPIKTWGQLAAGAVWDHGWHETSDRISIAARVKIGGKKYRLTGDGMWFARRDDGTPFGHWAAGGELQLTNGAWLTLSAGSDLGGMSSNDVSLLSSVKWGFSQAPSWKTN